MCKKILWTLWDGFQTLTKRSTPLFHRGQQGLRSLRAPRVKQRNRLRATLEDRLLKERDGFQTPSNGGYPRWRFGPSRNSIDMVHRSMSSQSGIASIEPRSSITSTPKGYRDGVLSGNFETTRSSKPLNSTKAGCRSQESLRHSVCMKQPSPGSSGQLECRFDPEGAGPHDCQREDKVRRHPARWEDLRRLQ